MDDFARLSPAERAPYIRETAARMNISEVIVEKDFWVCWTLKQLFSLEGIADHLIFKGGTSLSKCYDVIHRFSEDIDVSINRDYLGFGGANDPAQQAGSKQTEKKKKALSVACSTWVTKALMPALDQGFQSLGSQSWNLTVDSQDPDAQTLFFAYPTALKESLPYIRQAVKIEMGARSDHWPAEPRMIQPYIASEFPKSMNSSECSIKVLGISRTFWEKVTLLHAECHRDSGKRLPSRLSRHLYDLWAISQSPYFEAAVANMAMLQTVAEHKKTFFKSGWARYDLARPGTLRICPSEERLPDWKKDYADMQPMFFRKPPPFEDIIARSRETEQRVNADGPLFVVDPPI